MGFKSKVKKAATSKVARVVAKAAVKAAIPVKPTQVFSAVKKAAPIIARVAPVITKLAPVIPAPAGTIIATASLLKHSMPASAKKPAPAVGNATVTAFETLPSGGSGGPDPRADVGNLIGGGSGGKAGGGIVDAILSIFGG